MKCHKIIVPSILDLEFWIFGMFLVVARHCATTAKIPCVGFRSAKCTLQIILGSSRNQSVWELIMRLNSDRCVWDWIQIKYVVVYTEARGLSNIGQYICRNIVARETIAIYYRFASVGFILYFYIQFILLWILIFYTEDTIAIQYRVA